MQLKSKQTVLSVANASELAVGILNKVMGDEVANTLNGSLLSKAVLSQIVSNRVLANFSKLTKASV